ncbi:MAG TPA: DUF5667 domain-containing protein [Anaerolineales bacterium]|nr:DUF5667 domain-containing protein [Anaerolineales bacterium]
MSRPDRSIEYVLDRCLTRVERGEATLPQILAEFPDLADELRPLLETALQARRARPSLVPRRDFLASSEQRVFNLLQHRRRARGPNAAPARSRPLGLGLRLAPALVAAVLVAAVGLGGLGIVNASAQALPGDGLYIVKRGLEEVQLALTFDPENEAEILGGLVDERLLEIQALSSEGRIEDLETAMQGYAVAVGRLALASHAAGAGGPQSVLDQMTRHITVLEEVQARVPEPAQEAIERAIERSINTEADVLPGPTPTADQECIPGNVNPCPPTIGEHELRMAEQIAKIYGVTAEQTLLTYQGECQFDWNCVRTYYRELTKGPHGNKDKPNPHP